MKRLLMILIAILVWLLIVGIYGFTKPLPKNINLVGGLHSVPAESIHFFSDVTYVDEGEQRHSEQEIFDEIFRMIAEAQHYILVDMFFYSDFIGTEESSYRQLSEELTNALIAKKKASPNTIIQVITDPINTMYGGHESRHFEALKDHDIPVLITDLKPLRDSNPLYSAWWRTLFQWFGSSSQEGFLPHPLNAKSPSLGLRTYLSIFNYKANHRKVVITDYEKNGNKGLSVLTTSANPHDGSSAHSNSAMRIDHHIWRDALTSEKAVADFSQVEFFGLPQELFSKISDKDGSVQVQLLTERAIEKKIVDMLNGLGVGDTLDMAMFYIADRDIVSALKKADAHGAKLRLLFDPNKDAFGRQKNGIPNRQVAHELIQNTSGNTQIRWCDTHGEQCHSKLLIFHNDDGYTIIQGSANLTRRNIGNFNLETNTVVSTSDQITAIQDAMMFFEKTWNNEPGKNYSVEYSAYEDKSKLKTLRYRIKEFLGTNRW